MAPVPGETPRTVPSVPAGTGVTGRKWCEVGACDDHVAGYKTMPCRWGTTTVKGQYEKEEGLETSSDALCSTVTKFGAT